MHLLDQYYTIYKLDNSRSKNVNCIKLRIGAAATDLTLIAPSNSEQNKVTSSSSSFQCSTQSLVEMCVCDVAYILHMFRMYWCEAYDQQHSHKLKPHSQNARVMLSWCSAKWAQDDVSINKRLASRLEVENTCGNNDMIFCSIIYWCGWCRGIGGLLYCDVCIHLFVWSRHCTQNTYTEIFTHLTHTWT